MMDYGLRDAVKQNYLRLLQQGGALAPSGQPHVALLDAMQAGAFDHLKARTDAPIGNGGAPSYSPRGDVSPAPQPPQASAPVAADPNPIWEPGQSLGQHITIGQRPAQPSGAQALAVPTKEKHHKGLFPGKDWKTWVGILSDAMLGLANRDPIFAPAMLRQRQFEAEREAEFAKLNAPRVEQVGSTLGLLNPAMQNFQPFYTAPPAPQPFEVYAQALGLEPGTQEYFDAIKEYRAGTWNDEGVQGRLTVQQPRLDQSNTNNIRSTATSRENNIRSTSTSRENSIRSTSTGRGNNIRSTDTSRENNLLTNNTRLMTAGGKKGAPTSLPRVGSIEEARKLPPGTTFIGPDGVIRRKK